MRRSSGVRDGEFGDGGKLHEAGAFVDFADLGVAVELFYGVVFDETRATKNFNSERSRALGYFAREEFCHGGFFEVVGAGVFEAGGVVDEQAGGFDLHHHARELELHGLEVGEGLAELFALAGVAGGVRPGSGGEAEELGSDADAAFVEGFDGDLVAFAGFAEDGGGGDAAVF